MATKARVVVTGATGFLGGHCARALSGRYQLVASGRNQATLSMLQSPEITVDRVDLSEPSACDKLSEHRPDLIVHCAALSSPWGKPTHFEAANVTGTQTVLDACQSVGARLVYISTPSVYMNGTDRLNVDEQVPLPDEFVNDYARTKAEAERRVKASSVAAVILRPQGIIGAGDAAIAPRFERLTDRGIFPMIRGCDPLLDMTHVDNVVAAIASSCAKLLDGAWDTCQVFNVTNGDPRRLSELGGAFLNAKNAAGAAKRVRRLQLPHGVLAGLAQLAEFAARDRHEPIVTRYAVELLATSRTLSIDKARSLLDYDPTPNTIETAFSDYFAAKP